MKFTKLIHPDIDIPKSTSIGDGVIICKYVSISLNGVTLNFVDAVIPIVCDKIIFNTTDFIKVDLPAAFGPVISILLLIFI